MSEILYAIKFNAKASGKDYLGQSGVFPIQYASLADGHRAYAGIGDLKGETKISTSYFQLYDPEASHVEQSLVRDLAAYVRTLVTTKMTADTITIMEITTRDDASSYNIERSVEHSQALVGVSEADTFIIVSPEATLSTIPEGGTEATAKTKIDFVNFRVNGN